MQAVEIHRLKSISNTIYERYGVRYGEEKLDLLNYRLVKVMTRHCIDSISSLANILENNSNIQLIEEILDEVTIHKTDFFREMNHFHYISRNSARIIELNRIILASGEMRVWSAACSTGEEPYSLAMMLRQSMPEHVKIKVLGTDISQKVLSKAIAGVYPMSAEQHMDKAFMDRYFVRSTGRLEANAYLKSMVAFRKFNLIDKFPFRKSMDVIFCRNVLIYFDAPTQKTIL